MFINTESLWSDIVKIRTNAPLVHNITNYVVMNSSANALLAIGASPVMAHAEEEVADMVGIAGALVINIGTLSRRWVKAMHLAVRRARELGVPIILDPVGVGATGYRTETAHALLSDVTPTIIRGNASEISAIVMAEAKTKGVDSTISSDSATDAARQLSNLHDCVVCVSGAADYIVAGDRRVKVDNGHPLMPKVTGLGCTASALCGAFSAVNDLPMAAAAHAMATMGIAGEIAAESSNGPGSLQINFLDALHNLDEAAVKNYLKVSG